MNNKIATLVAALRSNRDCVLSLARVHDESGEAIPVSQAIEQHVAEGRRVVDDPLALMLAQKGPVVAAMNMATYRDVAVRCAKGRGFYRAANDYDLQLRLAKYGKFAIADELTHIQRCSIQGISSNFGLIRQIAYALYSADEAFRLSSGRQADLKEIMRARTEKDWSMAVTGLACLGDWHLLAKILPIGPRHARLGRLPGRFRRALEWLERREPELLRRWPAWFSRPPAPIVEHADARVASNR